MKRVKVESVNEIAEGVFLLEFKRFFEFEAGQIISLALTENEEPRMYSIASGEKDKNVQVLFNLINDGKLTPSLSGLKAGDLLWSSVGFGKFTGIESEAWWIAQGTGIAPFAAMFRSGQSGNKHLVHGGRFEDSFYYSAEFEPVLKNYYVRCCSRETVSGTFHGRVTDYLNSLQLVSPEPMYYLCGSSEMVVEVRDILIKKGVPWKRIVGEIYF